jgi:hypothetical protein
MGFGPPYAISFGVHFDPVISWFSTDNYSTRSEGAMPGFNFGISYNRYFGPNYSFSSGVSIINGRRRLICREPIYFQLKNTDVKQLLLSRGKPSFTDQIFLRTLRIKAADK